jgi:hypothetical protein
MQSGDFNYWSKDPQHIFYPNCLSSKNLNFMSVSHLVYQPKSYLKEKTNDTM